MASLEPRAAGAVAGPVDGNFAPGGEPSRYGEVFDRGYKGYDGPRLGRGYAIWRLAVYSMKRAMGIKKAWTAKVMPFLLYTSVAVPVAVGIGIRAFADSSEIFDYVAFFTFIFVVQGIFVASIAPEMLCGDRRENVLALYFSRAITRTDYLVAKLIATALLTMTVSLLPVAIYWLGVQLLEDSPLTAMKDRSDQLLEIVISGTLIALFLGSIALLVSAFTDRKGIAIAVIVIGFLVSTSIAVALFEATSGTWKRLAIFLSPTNTIQGLTTGFFGSSTPNDFVDTSHFDTWVYAAFMLGVTALCGVVMYLRYRPNE